MSGFSISNLFSPRGTGHQVSGQGAPASAGQGAAAATGTPPAGGTGMEQNNANAGTGANGTGEGNGGTGNAGAAVGSPLDSFTDIFKMEGSEGQPANPLSEKLLNLDPKKLSEAVAKMNFAQNVSAEQMQKALQGDTQAFQGILNQVSQNAMAVSTNMIVNMMEGAISKNNERFNSTLGDRFQEFSLKHQRPENAALNHPAAQPVLEALKATISNNPKNRGLSPSEIAKKAEDYFLTMADSINAAKTPANDTSSASGGRKPNAEEDWTQFLQTN